VFVINGRAHKTTNNFAGFGRVPIQGPDRSWESGGWADATASEYLDRLLISNEIFGTDFEVEGFGYGLTDKVPIIEISQSWVKFDPKKDGLVPEEVDQLMENLGFDRLELKGDIIYTDDTRRIAVGDLHDGNIVRGEGGKVYVIDAMISRY